LNLFELFVKIGVKDEASSKLGNITKKLGGGLKTAAKIGTAAISAASTAIVGLTKQAIESYAEYEQLIGGAELMFGDAFGYVQQKSQEAYKNVQMSQNEYLQQVNGFATGLKTALGGNEQAAAELADRIITAEADIVAATGNTQENVANAFAGIMKSNFTMLDNLQIGITPTKEGFQEVIDKVNEWNETNGKATDYQMGNLADMQSALVDYIDMVGYAGYANSEASGTIQGSLASAKAAWSNLVTGVADDNADFEQLIDDFVESVGVTASKILPKIQTALEGGGKLVEKLVPVIIEQIPDIVENTLPKMLASGVKIIKTILEGISKDPGKIVNTIFKIGGILIKSVWDLLPSVLKAALGIGKSIVQGVWQGIKNMVSWFTTKVKGFFKGIVDSVKENLGIHSPSRVFAAIGKNMAQGVGVGWDDEFGDIQDEINGSLDFSGGSASFSSVGGSVGGRPINITQNIYAQKKSAAQLMQEARWQAQMGVLAVV
jgi:phage-related protein